MPFKEINSEQLAKKVGVTQSRIAQIESGLKTLKITFDILLNILSILGFEYKIIPQKTA